MAKWSKQTLRKVRSYRAYKARLKKYGRETGQSFKAVPYSVYSEKYNERLKQVESGERKTFGSVGAELIKKENRPKVLYNEYKKRLIKRSDYLIERGLTPDNSVPMSYADFTMKYAQYYNDLKKEVAAGERKSVGDVVGTIVSDQVYKISGKKYNATMKAIKEWNENNPDKIISLGEAENIKSVFYQMKIRTEGFDDEESDFGPWFEMIRQRREELFAEGKSAKDVYEKISQTFYGS